MLDQVEIAAIKQAAKLHSLGDVDKIKFRALEGLPKPFYVQSRGLAQAPFP